MTHDSHRCDIAAFLFDSSSPDSFHSARNMMEAVSTSAGDTLPCVLLASKDDLGMAQVGDWDLELFRIWHRVTGYEIEFHSRKELPC